MCFLQANLGKLSLTDSSSYEISPPRVWGSLPRLAHDISIEQTLVLVEHSSTEGLILSVKLHGAEARGFSREPGSFIRRSATKSCQTD